MEIPNLNFQAAQFRLSVLLILEYSW